MIKKESEMNRQIKFRGKHFSSGKWVYGDLIHGVGCHYGNSYILPNQQWLPTDCDPLDGYRVNPNSVGQFTGLKDCNGKEIYEDDILKLDFDTRICIEKVEYRDGRFVSVDPQKTYKADALYLWLKYATIIGNIHDNPELLKGGDYGRNS